MHAMVTNLFLYVSIACLLASAAGMSAYDVLKSHGLPMGLLPKGVKDFQVDGDGLFEVQLEAACTAKFDSQSEVRFNSTVSGTLSYGQIAALSGVSAQELFLWFPVLGIRVDIPSSGLIYFDVGVIYKRFSLSLFETPLDCTPFSSETSLPSEDRSGKLRFSKLDQNDAPRTVL